jgi:hypothetical protein
MIGSVEVDILPREYPDAVKYCKQRGYGNGIVVRCPEKASKVPK